jgi:hypothetical protein
MRLQRFLASHLTSSFWKDGVGNFAGFFVLASPDLSALLCAGQLETTGVSLWLLTGFGQQGAPVRRRKVTSPLVRASFKECSPSAAQ